MEDYRICDECNGRMIPAIVEQEFHFNGKDVTLKGLNAYKCEECGNVVFLAEEAEMIDRLIRAMDSKPAV